MPFLGTGILKFDTKQIQNKDKGDDYNAIHYLKRILNKPCKDDILIPYGNLDNKELNIKIYNWYIIKPSSLEQFIVCKCKNYETEEIIYILFDIYEYFLCDFQLSETNEILKYIKNNIDKYTNSFNSSYTILKDFKIITNEVEIQSYYNFTEDSKIKLNNTDLILFMTPYKIERIYSKYNRNFNQYRWFYILNNVEPSGSYRINMSNLQNINIFDKNKIAYYCKNPKLLFLNPITVDKFIPVTRVSIDIECQHFGEFPTPNKLPISHICIDWFMESNIKPVKKIITLINYEIIKNYKGEHKDRFIYKEIDELLTQDKVYITLYCTEKYMLHFILYTLRKDFDYVLTYNGHNFDFTYIQGRRKIYKLNELCLVNAYKSNELKIYSYNKDTTYEIDSNNGIIFLDLYNYIKKNYNYNSYKLSEITKERFNIFSKIIDNNDEYIIKPLDISDNKNNVSIFYDVIRTANYCFINNIAYKIKDKSKIINDKEKLYDSESIKNSLYQEFKIYKNNTPITEENMKVMLSKDDVDIGDKNTYVNFTKDKSDDIAYYCTHDTVLCNCIFKYDMIHDKVIAFSNEYLLPQYMSFKYKSSINISGLLLKTLYCNRAMMVSGNLEFKKFEGGYVLEPKQKYIDGITAVFDFNSEYPSNIIEANLSPEKVEKVIELQDDEYAVDIVENYLKEKYQYPDYCYMLIKKDKTYKFIVMDRREPGIITQMIDKGMKSKNEYKKLKSINKNNPILHNYYTSGLYSKKITINSMYGLLGSERFDFNSPYCAEYCTALGQKCIKYIKNLVDKSRYVDNVLYFNKQNNPFSNEPIRTQYPGNLDVNFTFYIVYGDTDSLFINIKFDNKFDNKLDLVKKSHECFQFLSNIINDKKNIILSKNFNFEYEKMYIWMILLAKKKYIGEVVTSMNPLQLTSDTKGTALIRRDCTEIHKTILKNTIDILKEYLINNCSIQYVNNKINNYLMFTFKNIIENIQNLDINKFKKSVKYTGIYKDPNFYIELCIKKYNSKNPNDKIVKGQRFDFIYAHEVDVWNTETKKWNIKYTSDITKYMVILEDYIKDKNKYRICIEKYIKDIISNLNQIIEDKHIINNIDNMLKNYEPV
ncbi:DNA polymerase [Choristoneura rosaceana entomopoxvirus 'L']|uniref:DNA polymerase n=1 Tax=Choristoneura rosaceana entomopoxvirus 'L' TaxID=1293539 RepID=A0ABM9QK78_9POXV|nr:DNA polymerase [Choristoneura rosaceana entomopoxvirus 'L']CCU55950.1 DNA polymerase [Choristoneura rosaceana entomopoxvirus 'L']